MQQGTVGEAINFERLVDNSYLGITLINKQYQIVYRSPSALRITGWHTSELTNLSIIDMVHLEDRESVNAILFKCFKSFGTLCSISFRMQHRKGYFIWIESTLTNMLNEPEVGALVCTFIDVTEKKLNEERLQKTLLELSAYKKALDESSIVAITDQKGIINHVNQNFCKISKYNANELIGNDHRIVNSSYHDKDYIKSLWKTIAQGHIWKGELRNQAKDGSIYWVDTSIVPFLNEDGKPYQYVAIRSDITARKLNELVIVETLKEKKAILESIGDAFFAVDRQFNITYWNRVAAKILNKSRDEVLNKNLWELFPNATHTQSFIKYHEALNTNTAVQFEDYYSPLNSWFEVNAYPTENGLSVFFKDVTDRVRHIAEIEERNKKLSEIAWIQSHVLRAPLSRIMGLVQLIDDVGIQADESKEVLGYLLASAHELDDVVRDITEKSDLLGTKKL